MADLSKIKLNGTEYDLKDAVARTELSNKVNTPTVFDIYELPAQSGNWYCSATPTQFITNVENCYFTIDGTGKFIPTGIDTDNETYATVFITVSDDSVYLIEDLLVLCISWFSGDTEVSVNIGDLAPYNSNPAMNGIASAGSSIAWARGDHVHPSDTNKANLTDLPLIITASCNFTSSLTSGIDTPLEVTNVSKTYADITEAVSNDRPVKMIISNGNLKVNLDLTAFDGNIYYFTNSYDPFTGMANGVDNESFNITVRVERVNNTDVFTYFITYNKNAFATKSEITEEISTAIGNLTEFDTQVVQTLPATGVKGTIYFTPNNHGANDIYDEFIYVNNAWEKIGNTQVDLTGYARTDQLANVAVTGSYNNLVDTPDIPTKISDLVDDSDFITLNDVPVELPAVTSADNNKVLTVDNGVWSAKTPAIQFSGDYNDLSNKPTLFDGDYNSLSNKPTLFSGSYNDLSDKPTIPSATVVTQTITSGVKIAEINGTAIYAPAYANGDQIAY